MHTRLYLVVAVACVLCPGCKLASTFVHNATYEVGYCTNDTLAKARDCRLANEAWDKARQACPGKTFSSDYAEGFKAGYADYLYAGGSGEPPLIAPLHGWWFCSETPERYNAIKDWYAGFRHGAGLAQASGCRQYVLVPLSADPCHGEAPLPPAEGVPVPGPADKDAAPTPGGAAGETLPPPRKVDNPGAKESGGSAPETPSSTAPPSPEAALPPKTPPSEQTLTEPTEGSVSLPRAENQQDTQPPAADVTPPEAGR